MCPSTAIRTGDIATIFFVSYTMYTVFEPALFYDFETHVSEYIREICHTFQMMCENLFWTHNKRYTINNKVIKMYNVWFLGGVTSVSLCRLFTHQGILPQLYIFYPWKEREIQLKQQHTILTLISLCN